jgi:hypothetical protein
MLLLVVMLFPLVVLLFEDEKVRAVTSMVDAVAQLFLLDLDRCGMYLYIERELSHKQQQQQQQQKQQQQRDYMVWANLPQELFWCKGKG